MKKFLIPVLIAVVMAGCSFSSKDTGKEKHTVKRQDSSVTENARQKVAWQGTYQGILPCSSCEGVATMIVLKPDMTYTSRIRMLGVDDKDRTGEGHFEWTEDNSHIVIDTEGQRKIFRVHPEYLEIRMPNGDAIPTANPEAFQLMKTH
ncbi:MAG: copper resistance protein NlpE [Cardiobacteriaceae bacterium]|nr:copper resistance protein NlpE [Cardiobacteriaceae bacterium]